MPLGSWNWLEVARLFAGLLMPAALTFLGVYIQRAAKRFDHILWRSQKLIEKRLSVYDSLGPDLNDLLCYFTYVGCWRDLDPPTVISLKRSVDKKFYLAAPLFSEAFFTVGMEFLDLCFHTYSGWGTDARLRTKFDNRQKARPNDWKTDWSNCFSAEVSNPSEIRAAYKKMMEVFACDIGVHSSAVVPLTGRLPSRIA